MTCREFADFIMDYLDRELQVEVHQAFEHHISLCPACERFLRQYRATVAAGRAAFAAGDDDAVPADVPEALVTAILVSRRAL